MNWSERDQKIASAMDLANSRGILVRLEDQSWLIEKLWEARKEIELIEEENP